MKEKFKSFIDSPAPYVLISAAVGVTALVMYNRFLGGLLSEVSEASDEMLKIIIEEIHKK